MSRREGPGRPFALLDRLLEVAWRLPWLIRLAAAVGILVLLWLSSSMPPDVQGSNLLRALAHNGAHVVAFAGVAAAFWVLAPSGRRYPPVAATALAMAALYGLVDELHQRHVPGRSCSLVDLMSDSLGAGLAICLLQWRLVGVASAGRLLPWVGFVAVGSVILATLGPW